jgi:hypothetical protein
VGEGQKVRKPHHAPHHFFHTPTITRCPDGRFFVGKFLSSTRLAPNSWPKIFAKTCHVRIPRMACSANSFCCP